ncbi:transcription factor E [Acidianus sulfidivorans JP7]|uniref:Transcription factor E n=1 Tax=Acidianus sulfidivorans JP7 TaxID=619593 RepID=A0A2U9IQK7_9CREN|nr:transcription factor E [Acidianus sulfidivorans]AWR98266.1 transcription factor E [Acidianus sulfidivorans JP7]
MLNLAKDLLGDDVSDLLQFLLSKKIEMTDDEIANELGVKVNEIRKKLYLLADQGLVSYRRSRDKDSGWYIYYWKVNIDQINEVLINRKREILEKLKSRLEYESNNEFYICPEDKTKYPFEEAFENEFKCPKCGSQLTYYDSKAVRKILEEKINQLQAEIEEETKRGAKSS